MLDYNLIQNCCDGFEIMKQIHLLLLQDQVLQHACSVCLEWLNYSNVVGFA